MKFLSRLFNAYETKLGMDRWYNSYALANLSAGGVSVLIPLYVLHLGGGVGDIGLLTAIGNLVGVPASITWGILSDKWGSRKYFAVLGFFGVAISFMLMAFAKSFSLLLLLNATYILFWMSAASVVTVLIIEKEQRGLWESKIGAFNVSAGLGWSLGLVLGFIWVTLGSVSLPDISVFRYLFIILGISALLGAILAVRWIPGDGKFRDRTFRGRLLEVGDLITERFRYLPIHLYYLLKPSRLREAIDKIGSSLSFFIVAVGLMFCGFSVFFIPLPAYLKKVIELTDGQIYLLFIASALASALFYKYAAKLTKQVGPLKILKISLVTRIVTFPLVIAPFVFIGFLPVKLVVALAIFIVLGVSWALINVSNLVIVSRLAPTNIKGQAFGIYNGIIGISAVLGSLGGGYLAKFGGYFVTFLIASLFIAVGLSLIGTTAMKKELTKT